MVGLPSGATSDVDNVGSNVEDGSSDGKGVGNTVGCFGKVGCSDGIVVGSTVG